MSDTARQAASLVAAYLDDRIVSQANDATAFARLAFALDQNLQLKSLVMILVAQINATMETFARMTGDPNTINWENPDDWPLQSEKGEND